MAGVVVSEMIIDRRIAVETVIANSRKSRPPIPPIMRIGMNTAISDMLMENTVKPISLAPFNAAANGSMPFSRWRAMFRSEEHTSELQSHLNLVCRLLLEKKKQKQKALQHHAYI